MKKILFFLIIFSFQLSVVDSVSAQAHKKYSFRGKLGDKISFRLDLEQNQDGIIAGETTYYRKNGQIAKLPVYGWLMGPDKQCYWNGNALSLTEYDGIKECGQFTIAINDKGDAIEGHWAFYGKEYDVNSIEKTIFPTGVTYFHPAKGAEINGEYEWGVLPDSGSLHYESMGSCELTYKAGNVHYTFSVIPSGPEDENTVPLKGSYFNGQKDKFKYKTYIDKNFVCIWTTNYEHNDDWSVWSQLDNFYIKK